MKPKPPSSPQSFREVLDDIAADLTVLDKTIADAIVQASELSLRAAMARLPIMRARIKAMERDVEEIRKGAKL